MDMPARDPQRFTSTGEPRGYIQPHALRELWFHTGTACNLACPFCLEGSKPGDNRLQRITLEDARPFMDEAVSLGVEKFSFTGGEPFIVKDFVRILAYAQSLRPCLVLTNGTAPVLQRMTQIRGLRAGRHPVSFRVSIDWPEQQRHEAGRGPGSWAAAWQGLRELHEAGFGVSLARQSTAGEDRASGDAPFRALFRAHGLPEDLTIVSFPDFGTPGETRGVPEITESCMTRYQDEASRREFMCAFSKMVIKKGGRMRVYACTLVDDDETYDQGGSLAEAMPVRVMLGHHRCYTCFAYGASCSEL
ncbi:MAG: radical SAM protein [Gammaproteobacteria bacterium]|nr:MAG: radical SAM protein [Gammaproteobacteria bacterium]